MIPEINLVIESVEVVARTRKLKGIWTYEASDLDYFQRRTWIFGDEDDDPAFLHYDVKEGF